MNKHQTLPTLKAGELPLAMVALLTVAAFTISIVSLLSGWNTIFQNIFYLPIILACAYYTKRGFAFSMLLAAGYFFLMLRFSNDPAVLTGAFIRVLFFAVVAGVITYLSLIRIRTETSLRESEERYSSLFDNSYSVFLLIDPETGKIADANAAAARYYGYTHDELVSMGIYDLNRLPRETVIGNLQRAKTEGARHFLAAHYLASGEMRHVEIYSGPINLHGNSLFYSIAHDVTERKIAQDALQQVNRQLHLLSSITRHDILNQVTALKGYLELSEEVIDEPETLRKFIKNELQAANTIQRQISFTRDYGELGASAPTWQNVNETVRKATVELPVWDLHIEPDPADPVVYADPLFDKVFYNLIDNALRYGGPDLTTIRISSKESAAGLITVCEDDGVGISDEDKPHLFVRGFGKNTGFGLFLSREILGITGISIRENGEPGKGARFEMTVPKGAYRTNGVGPAEGYDASAGIGMNPPGIDTERQAAV